MIHYRSERVCDGTRALTGGYVLPGGGPLSSDYAESSSLKRLKGKMTTQH